MTTPYRPRRVGVAMWMLAPSAISLGAAVTAAIEFAPLPLGYNVRATLGGARGLCLD
jgi:hypothetical protein